MLSSIVVLCVNDRNKSYHIKHALCNCVECAIPFILLEEQVLKKVQPLTCLGL